MYLMIAELATYSLGHKCKAYLKEVRVSKRLGERDIKR